MVVGDITNLLEMFILNSSVVWVALCREKTNLLSEAEFIMKMREITDKGQLHLSKFATKQFALYMVSFCLVQIQLQLMEHNFADIKMCWPPLKAVHMWATNC